MEASPTPNKTTENISETVSKKRRGRTPDYKPEHYAILRGGQLKLSLRQQQNIITAYLTIAKLDYWAASLLPPGESKDEFINFFLKHQTVTTALGRIKDPIQVWFAANEIHKRKLQGSSARAEIRKWIHVRTPDRNRLFEKIRSVFFEHRKLYPHQPFEEFKAAAQWALKICLSEGYGGLDDFK